eukprot:364818-Chlamydomonas_euryale.AAC.35
MRHIPHVCQILVVGNLYDVSEWLNMYHAASPGALMFDANVARHGVPDTHHGAHHQLQHLDLRTPETVLAMCYSQFTYGVEMTGIAVKSGLLTRGLDTPRQKHSH